MFSGGEGLGRTLWRFAAEHNEVFSQECLYARQAQVCETRTAVEEGMNAAQCKVCAITQMHTLEHTGGYWTAVADLLRLGKRDNAAIRNVPALDQAYPLQFRQGS